MLSSSVLKLEWLMQPLTKGRQSHARLAMYYVMANKSAQNIYGSIRKHAFAVQDSSQKVSKRRNILYFSVTC